MFKSNLVWPLVPNAGSYPTTALDLVTEYGSRTEARIAGAPVDLMPDYNPDLPLKFWVDEGATGPTKYSALATVQEGATAQIVFPSYMKSFTLPEAQARTFNFLPDAPVYPPYVPQPTTAFINSVNGPVSPVNPNELSTAEQAAMFAALLDGGPVSVYVMAPGPGDFVITYPNLATDPRQQYIFTDSFGQVQTVGMLILQQNSMGVGYPGTWTADPVNRVWKWVPGTPPPVPVVTTLPVPIPQRSLKPGETVVPGVAGIGATILNSTFKGGQK